MPTITIPEFLNEPLSDFSDARVWDKVTAALRFVRNMCGAHTYPVIAGSADLVSEDVIESVNPSWLAETIGRVSKARSSDVEYGIHAARTNGVLVKWSRASFEERAAYLRVVAQKFRERRYFFVALMMLETGKGAVEADGEVSEAIDLLEWYALYAPFVDDLCNKTLRSPAGEKNSAAYIPIGETPICASIQPWNFPVAISVGPAAAALACGYAVLYKPAEQSSVIGYHIARLFHEAGVPRDVFQFLPGAGEEIGSFLVQHPHVNAVAFTGSKKVRQEIQRAIAEFNYTALGSAVPYEDRHEKRSLALESGGKNAVIVDSDADLDEAVVGVADSAFGFQGQKCSACSRLIIVDDKFGKSVRYEAILTRLSERLKSMPVGSPEDPKNKIGPLIDAEAVKKFHAYMDMAKKEGCRMVAEGDVPPSLRGCFVPPAIIADVSFNSPLARDEVFGPLLSVFCVSTFQGALALANDTEYALTAGVFSRNPRHIELSEQKLNAGNIYVNRKTTGAVVGRQPFGGFKMSGNSTKAGGWDYLLSFLLDRKNVCENTMRRGVPLG